MQKVCGTLDHCFITTHIIHNEVDLQIYVYVIFLETRHHAQVHVTSGTLIDFAFFGRKNTASTGDMWKISLACVYHDDSRVAKHLLRLHLVFQPIWVGRSWLFPASSIKFLTSRSLKSRWVYLAPHEDNSIQLLSSVRSRRWKNAGGGSMLVSM